ncbi:hypothetical protein LDL36_17660 [Komagataeibacter sp. FNDCR1]|nr:hypothetical protein [Komagataeibacter sp. FNDCR1]
MSLSTFIKDLVGGASSASKHSMSSYCFVETVQGSNLVMKDGSLATIVSFNGSSRLVGEKELNSITRQAAMSLAPLLSTAGHALQVVFTRNPDTSEEIVKNMVLPSRTVAQRLGLNLDDLFDEQESNLSRFIVNETIYFVLWTRTSLISSDDAKRDTEERKAKQREVFGDLLGQAPDMQNLFAVGQTLLSRHETFVETFLNAMSQLRLKFTELSGVEALRAIHNGIYTDKIGKTWTPRIPLSEEQERDLTRNSGSKKRGVWLRPDVQDNMAFLLWPRVEDQIFHEGAEYERGDIIRIGHQFFACCDMTGGPQRLHDFSNLISRMKIGKEEFPWRVAFTIEGDGLSTFRIRKMLASVVRFSNKGVNGPIATAFEWLQSLADSGKGLEATIARIRLSFSTWSPVSAGLRQIERRSNALQRAVESWGFCEVSPSPGDPLAGVLSSVPALDIASTAPSGAAPLPDILYTLPWQREASPFPSGSVLLRTDDGRPFLYEMGSSQQDGFVDLIFAVPGRGKSVLLNTTNLAFCLSPNATSGVGGSMLPMVRIIDIGPSAAGLISLLKNALPAHRRHEAVYREMKMTTDEAINPFDTPLGCRKPLEMDKTFLKNFLTVLGTPDGELKPPAFLSDVIGAMIDEVYKQLSDREKRGNMPRIYAAGEDREVDEGIVRYGLPQPETWWQLVDMFMFEAHDDHLAALAQRHAVPRLEDMLSLESNSITDVYGNAPAGNGSITTIETFKMMISSAIREYSVLSQPTRFDLGNARVVALNLQSVTSGGGGASGVKRCAVMYMLASFIMTKDFYHNPKILNQFDERYRDFHTTRIQRIRETPKRIVFDEFHRTAPAPNVRLQVVEYMREGRKWDIQIALASQLLGDFDKDMVSLSTSKWLLGVETATDVDECIKKFELSASAANILRYKLKGPRTNGSGAPILNLLTLKSGVEEHYLINTLGAQMAWAFSTTAQDVNLRERLYVKLGPELARTMLARRYPKGSAKADIQARNAAKAELGVTGEDADMSVIDEVAAEIEEMAAKLAA